MPDTTNRPTPEQILDEPTSGATSWALAALAEHGYVIVHPDDVPEGPYLFTRFGFVDDDGEGYREGWNACRAHIFGDDQ